MTSYNPFPSSRNLSWESDESRVRLSSETRSRKAASRVFQRMKGVRQQSRPASRKKSFQFPGKAIWLILCLFGFATHSYFVICTYLDYEVATETVIETPKQTNPPATSVCLLIWHLLKSGSFESSHPCRQPLRKRRAIEKCVKELIKFPLKVLMSMTNSVLSYFEFAEIRNPDNNVWTNYEAEKGIATAVENGRLKEYFNGPYRCVRMESGSKKKMPTSLLTKGFPKSRYFVNASFKINPAITPQIGSARVYVHEQNTFPRGAITLPAVLNVTREQLFIVSYQKVETFYLESPYSFNCIDYSGDYESREHCIENCMASGDDTLPFSAVVTDLTSNFNLIDEENFHERSSCRVVCPVDCYTRTFYTKLADSSDEEDTLTVITRFQEPETVVRYIPKLDLQSFIIYEAGILGLWFSASVFYILQDALELGKKVFRALVLK